MSAPRVEPAPRVPWTLDECRQRGRDAYINGLVDGPTGLVDPEQIGAWNDGFAAAQVWRGSREQLALAARAALDQLTGPERVEVIRHYLGSAKKAVASSQPLAYDDDHASEGGGS